MQIYLGDKTLNLESAIRLGDTNIETVFMTNPALAAADAFIDAAGITDSNQQLAILNLVNALFASGLWLKMYAIYPFVGGSATSHKYNLKNPQDTDAAFRINFVGGWTHNSNGITGNAVNTYANTFLSPSGLGILTNGSIGIYSRTNSASNRYDMGAFDIGSNQLGILARGADNKFYAGMPIDGTNTATNTNSLGLYTACQTGGNTVTGYKNGTQVVNQSDAFTAAISNSIFIGATYDSLPVVSSNRNYAFAFIGNTLSASDVSTYYNIVQDFQTALGRQV